MSPIIELLPYTIVSYRTLGFVPSGYKHPKNTERTKTVIHKLFHNPMKHLACINPLFILHLQGVWGCLSEALASMTFRLEEDTNKIDF